MVVGRRVGLAGFMISAVLTFGACGGSPSMEGGEQARADKSEPAPEPTPTRTPTPEPTPTPTLGLAAELEATANEFYTKLAVAYETHETEPFRMMGGRGCNACYDYLDNVEQYEKKQQHLEGLDPSVTDFRVVGVDKLYPVARFSLNFAAGRIASADGDTVQKLESEVYQTEIEFEKVEGKWVVAEQREV